MSLTTTILYHFHWPLLKLGVTKSLESKTFWFHFLAHCSTDQDKVWWSFSVEAVQVEHPVSSALEWDLLNQVQLYWLHHCLFGLVVRRLPREQQTWVWFPLSPWIFLQVESMVLQWLPYQMLGVIGSALGLVSTVSVHCYLLRWYVWSAVSNLVWQQVQISEQICPCDTLACSLDVSNQPTATDFVKKKNLSFGVHAGSFDLALTCGEWYF